MYNPIMPNYIRAYRPGGTFFFTLVTYDRAPFLCEPLARRVLRDAIDECRNERRFTIDAFVLLPDHLHAIWTLPENDADFSTRWSIIKRRFTQMWRAAGGEAGVVSESRFNNRRRGVWQRRFWEHVIRDEGDFEKHLNYIHFNPVKHSLATCPHSWEWSSFHRQVDKSIYAPDWCCACDGRSVRPPDFTSLNLIGME
jgi:putative transposase